MSAATSSPLYNAAAIGLVVCAFVVGCRDSRSTYRIDSIAMEPTLKSGHNVTVDRHSYKYSSPARWDVIVFKHPTSPGTMSAMRIVGLPGETILIDDSGLLVNGVRLEMPQFLRGVHYLRLKAKGTRFAVDETFSIPADSYFVLGDNTGEANDSRIWGALSLDRIVGKVISQQ